MNLVFIGQLMALGTSVCGAVTSLIYNKLGNKFDSNIMAYTRMLIALPMMIILSLVTDKNFVFDSRTALILICSGLIGFFITDLFMFRSFVIWGARETMVVICLAPVFSCIFAYMFFRESIDSVQLIGVLLTVIGVFMMVSQDMKLSMDMFKHPGFACALLAAFLQSVADMTAKAAASNIHWVTATAIRGLGGTVGWLIFGAICGKKFFTNFHELTRRKNLVVLTGTVLIGTVIGTVLAMGGLKYAPAGIVTTLKQISPLFILPYELIVQKKRLGSKAILGTVLSVAGVSFLFLF